MSLSDKLKKSVRNTVLGLSLVGILASCNGTNPPPGGNVPCPFNPAVMYATEQNVLLGYDLTGFGTDCKWNPNTDLGKPADFFLNESTKDMIDWMAAIDDDDFYTDDQIQSLVTRFGEGIINPETGQKVTNDTGRVNVDEYGASRDFYEKAKEMHDWAVANQHRSSAINPDHYTNFNAWSVRLFGWPYPNPEFTLPKYDNRLNVSGLEPNPAFGHFAPVNWGLTDYGTPEYELSNFISKEGEASGNEEWEACGVLVEDNFASSQNFVLGGMYWFDQDNKEEVLVQSMLYSPGTVVRKLVSTPGPPVDWYDMVMSVEYPVSATLMDIGGYDDGHRLTMAYAHISGVNGNMEDPNVPDVDDVIPPRAIFARLNEQRPLPIGDFQGYVPAEANIPGPHRPGFPHRTQVDMYIESLPPGQKAGFNDPRANRHDEATNYSIAIGNRSIFAPCIPDYYFPD
jgi:hypothetical protein